MNTTAKYLVLTAIFAQTLTACGSSKTSTSNSVNSEGNCTSRFVSDHNNVVSEARSVDMMIKSGNYTKDELRSKFLTVQSACRKFFTNHPSITCTAEVNDKPKEVSTDELKPMCDQVDAELAKL